MALSFLPGLTTVSKMGTVAAPIGFIDLFLFWGGAFPAACQILVLPPGIEPVSLALEV